MSVYDELPPCDHDDCSKLKCNHAATSQPTELDKAIEYVKSHVYSVRTGDEGYNYILYDAIDELLLAAECAQELEKERDEYYHSVVKLSGDIKQLRDDLKQCSEALHKLKWHDLRSSHVATECFVCERVDSALSLPSVQTALKEDK